jgi:DnaJ-class molecular chaperone
VPNRKGPGEIIDINDTNAKIKFKNNIKVLKVAELKQHYEKVKKSEEKEVDANQRFNQNINQNEDQAVKDFSDIFNQVHIDGQGQREIN